MKKLLFKLFFALAFASISLHGQEKIQQVEVHKFWRKGSLFKTIHPQFFKKRI